MRVTVTHVAVDPDDPGHLQAKIDGAIAEVEMSRRVVGVQAVPVEPTPKGFWQRWAIILSTTDEPGGGGA